MAETNGVYATQADLIAKYGDKAIIKMCDRNNDGTIDVATLARIWSEVDGEIDAHLATAGYKKSQSGAVPAFLKGIAIDLAYASMHTSKVSELVEGRAKLARENLIKIASGKMKLSLDKNTSTLGRKSLVAKAKKAPKSIISGM